MLCHLILSLEAGLPRLGVLHDNVLLAKLETRWRPGLCILAQSRLASLEVLPIDPTVGVESAIAITQSVQWEGMKSVPRTRFLSPPSLGRPLLPSTVRYHAMFRVERGRAWPIAFIPKRLGL